MDMLFSYFKCGTCAAHRHCEECADAIRAALVQRGSFSDIILELSYERKRISCRCDEDEDGALDFLESIGIFEL